MLSIADLPETLALFPLPGVILLPRARLPLHIFEPRYLSMVEDALKSQHRMIGMIQPRENAAEELHEVGCAGRITSFAETEGSRFLITLTGVARFEIARVNEGFTPYLRGDANWTPFDADTGRVPFDPDCDRDAFLTLLRRYLEHQELASDWEQMKGAADEALINALSMMCPFNATDKQALLEAPGLAERREILVTLFEYALRAGHKNEVIQ